MQRVVDARIFDVNRIGGRVRIRERDVGSYCGLELPGPRETELLEAKWGREREVMAKMPPRATVDHWLYWLYDVDDRLLYVGITNSGVKRMEQHGAQKEWWPRVATIRVEHFATRAEAERAEREAIREHLPPYNVVHGGPRE